jgi:hypothetical protein
MFEMNTTREFSEGANRRLGKLFFVLTFIGLMITIWFYLNERDFVRTAHKAKGEVIKVQKNNSWPTVRYVDLSGKAVSFRPSSRSSSDNFSVGEVVELLHGEGVPAEVKLNGWFHLWAGTFFAAISSGILGIFAALALSRKMRWGPLRRNRLTIDGG